MNKPILTVILKDFNGYLHADGYEGYHALSGNIKVVGCFAHARRKFDEAIKGLSKKEQADYKLFSIERDFAKLTAEERFQKRQELSKPVFDEFYKWLAAINPPDKTVLHAAVVYMRN